jgi:lipoprotein NlpI
LRFSEFGSWDEVTRWAESLFESAQGDSPEMQHLAAQFRQLPTDADRVSAALAWVQQQVRYISLSFGESSHRPSPAAVTLARRYGDCKDKSALLVQLLRNLGMQADPVLLSSYQIRGLDKHLPSPDSFDHAIVRVQLGSDTYYLDPTRSGQSGRVANMGQAWDGAQVLVVRDGNAGLSEIKAEAAARTTMVVQERIVLTDWQKPGVITVRMTWTGTAAEAARVAFAELSDDRIAQSLLANYERRYPGHKIVQKLRIEDDKNNNTLAVQFALAVPTPAVSEPKRWVVRYEANNIESVLPMPPSSIRKQPLALPYRMSMRYGVEVQFPPGVSVAIDPTTSEYRPPGLYISRASSFRGNRATMTLDLSVLQPQVDPKDMRKYMDWVEWLRGQSRSSWWVAKGDPKESEAARPQTDEARVNKIIERLDAVIKSGRLQGDDVAYAYCERAVNYSYKRDAQNALQDLDRALRLNAGLPEVQKCAGFVMLRLDRVTESIDAYGQAIVLGNPDSGAYLERGIAKVAAGHLESAEADFISSIRFNPLKKQYAQIWQSFVVRRTGRKLDNDLSALAAASATGPWPAPMLALMGDAISPQQLLAATDVMKGEERDIALVEANHAIGQWNLARGDKAAAAEAFRKAVASGLILQWEHESARRELANLGLSQ